MAELEAVEPKRGCGYRKVEGLYLVGTGLATPCDLIPLELKPCITCGFQIPFSRGFLWLNKQWIMHYAANHQNSLAEFNIKCECTSSCPICYPWNNDLDRYGLMWVGQRWYTPKSFIREAQTMAVCKRISQIPKDLILGETWVLLAHKKVPFEKVYREGDTVPPGSYMATKGMMMAEPEYKSAIFYAFVPQLVEKLIWESKATQKTLAELKEQGITPVIIPDHTKAHAGRRREE